MGMSSKPILTKYIKDNGAIAKVNLVESGYVELHLNRFSGLNSQKTDMHDCPLLIQRNT